VSDRAALHAAVCADPDDDTPRLALADWLDENGETKRSAFIRAQVERARRAAEHADAADVWRFLEQAGFSDLGDIDWSKVAPDLGALQALETAATKSRFRPALRDYGLTRVRGVEFRDIERGFHHGIWVDKPDAFLKNARDIFRAIPLSYIWFQLLTAEQAREVVAGGYLARLRRLTVSGQVEPEAIRILGNHSDAAGVSWLGCYGGDGVGERVAALLAGAHWSGVTSLELMSLDHDYDGSQNRLLGALLSHHKFRRVRYLDLFGNGLGDAACRTIATAGLTELRYLNLNFNEVGEAGALALAGSKSLPNLRYLALDTNGVGGTGAAALIVSRKLPNLAVLDFDTSDVRGPDPKVLAGPSRGPTLRVLNLRGAELNGRGLAALGKCPAVQGLWFLSFHLGGVSDSALVAFTKGATLGQLTAFDLENNKLTARGMEALARWPGAASLQSIDVSGNEIGAAGGKALVESPHFQKIRRINASGRAVPRLRKHFGKKVVP
jgi:uncharacterized protein (TIGR02996 family)